MGRSAITKRELEIIKLVANGSTSEEIAKQLVLSVRTIDAHRYNSMHKLDANTAGHLVSICYNNKLLKLDS